MFGEEEVIKLHRSRAQAIINILLIAFAVILARLWYLQIYKGKILYEFSLKNRLRKEVLTAPRGMMFSRNNFIMVDNVPRFDAILTPQYLLEKEKTITILAKILGMDVLSINKIIEKNRTLASYKPIIIKKNISRAEVAKIETQNFELPGVSVDPFISREYIDNNVGAHLFGYISEINQDQLPKYRERDDFDYRLGDFIGQFGMEEELDLILRGENGFEFAEVDAFGRKKKHLNSDNLFKGIKSIEAIPGNNVRLTIDRDLQLSAAKALEGQVGSLVAVQINSGEVFAMVSSPSFDPAAFSRGLTTEYWRSLITDDRNPLRNRNIQEHYSPGSVLKTITLAAALEEGVVDKNTVVNCPGRFFLGKRPYHCWKKHGHGNVDALKALRESCDVYFYKIATMMDIDVLARYANMFGLGERTGIELPGEESGLIPTKEWKLKRNGIEWQKGETLSCAIGQSYMLTTPLQLALSYAAIANGGTLYKPRLVREIFSNSGTLTKKAEPEIKKKISLSETTKKILKEGLYQVVNSPSGTVYSRRGNGLDMSGKTGTSQVIRHSAEKLFSNCLDLDYKSRHHALFVGYAPSDNPEIAVSAVIEHGCSGSKAAAPVVVAVIQTYMEKYLPAKHQELIAKQKKEQNRAWAQAKLTENDAVKVTPDSPAINSNDESE
jgi:penicillin-binding protein 2